MSSREVGVDEQGFRRVTGAELTLDCEMGHGMPLSVVIPCGVEEPVAVEGDWLFLHTESDCGHVMTRRSFFSCCFPQLP